MAIQPASVPLLTYERYRSEGEIDQRYDIVDGIRIYMPSPKWRHQQIVVNLVKILDRFKQTSGNGNVIPAPFDVLISRHPLHIRQPDVLFITGARLEQGGGIPDEGPLEVAPELVVEILSASETTRSVREKLTDYSAIGVQECWLVQSDTDTVEVLRLTGDTGETVATYAADQTLRSDSLPNLTFQAAKVFAT